MKENWAPGPWQFEPDRIEWKDEHTGLVCLMVRTPILGNWCGYVGVPPNHKYYGLDYSIPKVSVHGTLNSAGPCREGSPVCHVAEPGEPDNVWWFGFDCAHALDLCPYLSDKLTPNLKSIMVYRDQAYVASEVTNLARQLNE